MAGGVKPIMDELVAKCLKKLFFFSIKAASFKNN